MGMLDSGKKPKMKVKKIACLGYVYKIWIVNLIAIQPIKCNQNKETISSMNNIQICNEDEFMH